MSKQPEFQEVSDEGKRNLVRVEEVQILIGVIEVCGFSEGGMVTVEKNEDWFIPKVGDKGEVARSYNPDHTGVIRLKLMHTTPFIKTLQDMVALDSGATSRVPPLLTFEILDPGSHDQILAACCWLQKDAVHEWGREVGEREYEFFAVDMVTPANLEYRSVLYWNEQYATTAGAA